MTPKPLILVVGTTDACRSQMAAGFLRQLKGDSFEVHSAGVEPEQKVNPIVVAVMNELSIDIRDKRPRPLSDFFGKIAVDHVLLVSDKANKKCPRLWPGAFSRTYFPFDDAQANLGTREEQLAEFRRVRDLIGAAMKRWAQ